MLESFHPLRGFFYSYPCFHVGELLTCCSCLQKLILVGSISENVSLTPILKSLVVPVIWLALIGAIYSWIAPFFVLNRIFFLANEKARQMKVLVVESCRAIIVTWYSRLRITGLSFRYKTFSIPMAIRFQGLFKIINQVARKWKTKSIMWQIWWLLFPKLLIFRQKNGWI